MRENIEDVCILECLSRCRSYFFFVSIRHQTLINLFLFSVQCNSYTRTKNVATIYGRSLVIYSILSL